MATEIEVGQRYSRTDSLILWKVAIVRRLGEEGEELPWDAAVILGRSLERERAKPNPTIARLVAGELWTWVTASALLDEEGPWRRVEWP